MNPPCPPVSTPPAVSALVEVLEAYISLSLDNFYLYRKCPGEIKTVHTTRFDDLFTEKPLSNIITTVEER